MDDNILQIIKKAIDMVKEIPEPYQKPSFEIILKHYLTLENTNNNEKIKSGDARQISANIEPNRLVYILKANYEWSESNTTKLVGIGQYLNILKIVMDEFGVNDLSSAEIQKLLYEKFRISKTINAIGMSLMKTVGKYVDRVPRGKEYFYRITSLGREHLHSLTRDIKDDEI